MKYLIALVISLILVFTTAFIALYYSFNLAEPGNLLDQEVRPLALTLPFAKDLFNLDRIGDAAPLYLSAETGPIIIEIDMQSGLTLNPMVETWLDQISDTTVDKTTQIIVDHEHPIPTQTAYTDADLRQIIDTHTHFRPSGKPYLHLIYLSQSAAVPSNAGRVINQDTIFMFQSVIDQLSSRPHIQARLEQSTLMHEWAHLLGLEHINKDNCIMSQTVEVMGDNRYQAGNIPVEFCPETLYQIKRLQRGKL